MNFRHEWKHEITVSDLITIRQRMRVVAASDEHATDGKYRVRSLYFDTPTDRVFREKRDGVGCREKFRLRYYNDDLSWICLEKKAKQNGLGSKQSVCLTQEETAALLRGEPEWMAEHKQPLVQELYAKMKGQGVRPKTIVEYVREPFVYAPGNVRVTLDYNIRTGLLSTDFLNPDCVLVPVEAPVILEVKWDAFLPSVIRDAVGLPGRRAGAFSKYAVCRRYD